MNDNTMLSYFLNELTILRETGKRFSHENPDLARHLQYDQGFGQNPQLAQLIESLVFMNARVSYQFQQEHPQMVSELIGVLYPHLTSPIPSMAIIQWPAEKTLEKSFYVPRGTLVETDPKITNSARFSTVYDIKVHPIQVVETKLLDSSELTLAGNCQGKSIIQLRIVSSHPKVALSSLDLADLQFYIQGDSQLTYLLYEVLMNECASIAFVDNNQKNHPYWLSRDDFYPMGFSNEEAILPLDPRTLSGQRIVTEFFALPQKFLFFKLLNLPKINIDSQFIDIYFHLKSKPNKALFQITHDNFQLGCTPIVNLFPKVVEPIQIKQQHCEYQIIVDLRRPQDYEIYNIQSVTALHNKNKVETYHALFSNKNKSGYYWHTRRVSCSEISGNTLNGTELMMTISSELSLEGSDVVMIQALCTNRDLTAQLAQQISLPALQSVHGNIPPSKIRWVEHLTEPQSCLFSGDNYFILLQCLASNFLGFMNDKAQQLKNILELHILPGQKDFRYLIDCITDMSCQRMSAFLYQTKFYGYCNGIKIILKLKQRPHENIHSWIFFNILEKFFADLLPMNSFIQLSVVVQEEEIYQWPIRVGEQNLM